VRGIGIDLVSVEEFARRLERTPSLRERLFSPRELELSYSPESLAGRFAVKEAVLKALGTGLSGGISWRDVEVVGGVDERPRVVLSGRAKEVAEGLSLLVSVSHAHGLAVAVCVAVSSRT